METWYWSAFHYNSKFTLTSKIAWNKHGRYKEGCGKALWNPLYIKSHLIVIHTALKYLLIIGMVQVDGAGGHEKKFQSSVLRKCYKHH